MGAIWLRVTGSSGQKRSLVGGLQPRVMSAAARAAMSYRSEERRVGEEGRSLEEENPKTQNKKAAMWPGVKRSSGQRRSWVGGLQPRVMKAAARAALSASNTEPLVSERGRALAE